MINIHLTKQIVMYNLKTRKLKYTNNGHRTAICFLATLYKIQIAK